MIDFVNNPYNGEMLPYERDKLYNWIIDFKPKVILEVGCGNGGSTYYMAEATKGYIYTCDSKRSLSKKFISNYPHVEFYQMRSDVFIQSIIDRNLEINFIMFDGPEDPDVALRDVKVLEKYIIPGTYFCMHDWELGKRKYDGVVSTKALKIRPYIEKSKRWKKIKVLTNSKKSVGLCLYVRI